MGWLSDNVRAVKHVGADVCSQVEMPTNHNLFSQHESMENGEHGGGPSPQGF